MAWYETGIVLLLIVIAVPLLYLIGMVLQTAALLLREGLLDKPDPAWDEYLDKSMDLEAELETMPLQQARSQSLAALKEDGTDISVVEAAPDAGESLERFGPCLREVFARFSHISSSEGWLDRKETQNFDWLPGYFGIGQGMDGHSYFMIRPGGDAITEICSDDFPLQEEPAEDYATVYHWILKAVKNDDLLEEYQAAKARKK